MYGSILQARNIHYLFSKFLEFLKSTENLILNLPLLLIILLFKFDAAWFINDWELIKEVVNELEVLGIKLPHAE